MQKQIPHGIITDRLMIRCYNPGDAQMVLEAITNSLDNLKKWMLWARSEPLSLESKRELLKKFEHDYIQNIDYNFGIFNKEQNVLIGSAGLHTRIGPKSREIGYWINSTFLNKGYATESTKALIKIGFEYHQIDNIQIHCDPMNIASQKIPKKLGFDLTDLRRSNATRPDGKLRDTMIWNLTLKRFQETRHLFPEIEVFYKKN